MRPMRPLAAVAMFLIGIGSPARGLAQDPGGAPEGTITVAPGATWRIEVGPAGFVVTAGGGSVQMPAGSAWRVDAIPGAGWAIGLSLPPAPAPGPAPANSPAPAGSPNPDAAPQPPPRPPDPPRELMGHVRDLGRAAADD
jgi:hypothetical protein